MDRLHCEFRSALIGHFMDRNIVMRPRVHSEREDWLQQMVAAGVGICALPERSAIVGGIALRPVAGLDLSREVSLCCRLGLSGNPREAPDPDHGSTVRLGRIKPTVLARLSQL